MRLHKLDLGFKPYYKWITFNTVQRDAVMKAIFEVLNLIINGLPSILYSMDYSKMSIHQVLNLIINGLPSIQKT